MFIDTAEWCRSREIDPRLWIYLLFRARMWTWAPQLAAHHLMSEKMISRYEKLSERALNGYRDHVSSGKTKSKYDPNWQLTASVEALKRLYSQNGDVQRCMRESIDKTLGYHPKSSTCQVCPIQQQCSQQLVQLVDFDILALRRGDITPEQARAGMKNA